MLFWLVVDLFLWQIWVRQLGWCHSQSKNITFTFQSTQKPDFLYVFPWQMVDLSIVFSCFFYVYKENLIRRSRQSPNIHCSWLWHWSGNLQMSGSCSSFRSNYPVVNGKMGKPEENHGKTRENIWESHRKTTGTWRFSRPGKRLQQNWWERSSISVCISIQWWMEGAINPEQTWGILSGDPATELPRVS